MTFVSSSNTVSIRPSDIRALENAQQVIHFFANLGYDVDQTLTIAPQTLGMDTNYLTNEINSIRQIAVDPVDEEIHIYLFEVRSVTQQLIQTVARRFRERLESALLVMTSDYETLDFVLLERDIVESRAPGRPLRQLIRPRQLSVERRNPSSVSLRVLKRFAFTEIDGFFQWEKLKSAYTLAEWTEQYFNNRALFSDHYLKSRLTEPELTPEWDEDVRPVGRDLYQLLAKARQRFDKKPEAVVRRDLYEPIFDRLGFRVVAGKGSDSAVDEPDYRLFAPDDEEGEPLAVALVYVWDRNLEDEDEQRDEETPDEIPGSTVVSVLERAEAPWAIVTNGKLWRLYSATAANKATNYYEVDLEEALFSHHQEHDQVDALKYWWLFFRRQAYPDFLERLLQQSNDYAKDLGERLKDRVFTTIFPHFARGFIANMRAVHRGSRLQRDTPQDSDNRRSCLQRDNDRTSHLDRDDADDQTAPHDPVPLQMEPTEQQRDDNRRSRLQRDNPEDQTASRDPAPLQMKSTDLDAVFQATLTFLYRLMFILYAESLELLPVYEDRGYAAQSLRKLKEEIAANAGTIEDKAPDQIAKAYSATETNLYTRLQALFTAISQGSEALNLPQYNGRLFSDESESGQFLARYAIPDRHLALGLDRLARDVDEKTKALAFIDYKDLGVRHLGSIYEGLLEFKLRIADQPLVVVKEDRKEVYLPQSKAKNKRVQDRIAKGDVYLENDKRERKATGSYYTPDYIVKYIVAHTVGPVLDRKFAELTPRLRDCQQRYLQSAKRAEIKKEDPAKFWNNPDVRQLADDCLDVRVLDPAMGSGHFLVEVVDYVSNRLITFLNAWSHNPVWAMLAQIREDILDEMNRQHVSIDADRLTRVALLKRAVLKRCIYGVDLNEMAVELAKVSLWLDAFTLGAPLSFLDHHLKQGNSLIGSRVDEVRQALSEGQISLFASNKFAGVMLATDLMRQVSYLSDNTVQQVEASRSAYDQAAEQLAPFKRILDVYTSRWFGNEPSKKGTDPALEFLQRDDIQAWLEDPASVDLPADDYMNSRTVAQTALDAAETYHFFHWELEFPEIFFAPSTPGGQDVQLKEDGGFDAVVGNPPYVATGELKEANSEAWKYYKLRFSSASSGKFDIYLPFLELSWRLIAPHGRSAFILPNKWLKSDAGNEMRKLLAQEKSVESILDFGALQVFQDQSASGPTTYTCVCILSKNQKIRLNYGRVTHLPTLAVSQWNSVSLSQLSDEPWNVEFSFLSDKTDYAVQDLENVASIFVGTTTNADSVFILEVVGKEKDILKVYSSEDDKVVEIESQICVPFLRGRDISRFTILNRNVVVLFPYLQHQAGAELIDQATMVTDYPLAWDYLNRHREKLEGRERGKWRGKEDWYCHAYPRNHGFREAIKLLTPDICNYGSFCLDEDGIFHSLNTVYGISDPENYELEFLLALLNSHLFEYFIRANSVDLRGGYYRVSKNFMAPFPVRTINFTTPADRRQQLVADARRLYARSLDGSGTGNADDDLLTFVQEQLDAGASDVVHDLLAFLAQTMIDLNKEKQTETDRFLGWLEDRLAIQPRRGKKGIEALSGYTILQNFLGDYQKDEPTLPWDGPQDGFLYRLRRNKSRFRVPLDDALGEIQTEYENALAVLLPIKRRLAHTDALIDKIVYKLYGLTPDEIDLIERPGYEQSLQEAKQSVVASRKLDETDEAVDTLARELLIRARNYFRRNEAAPVKARLDEALPGWHLYPDDIAIFLLTGEDFLMRSPDYVDFSPTVVAFAKAVEAMIYNAVLKPFRDDPRYGPDDVNNKVFARFMRGETELTWGNMTFFVPSSKEKALHSFIRETFYNADERWFGDGGIIDGMKDDSVRQRRNKAVHEEIMTKEEAEEFRNWALGMLRQL